MKVLIEFECDNAAFAGDESSAHMGTFFDEVGQVLTQAQAKLKRQASRKKGCICTAPEAADKLLDSNGNTIGTVRLIQP